MEKILEEYGFKRFRKKREVVGGSTGLREKIFFNKRGVKFVVF